jgi:hypothetical protein
MDALGAVIGLGHYVAMFIAITGVARLSARFAVRAAMDWSMDYDTASLTAL